jgi:hypothetical protein
MRQTQVRQQCRQCYFCRKVGGKLYCMRNSPLLRPATGEARWPCVRGIDHCGQFRACDDDPLRAEPWPQSGPPIYHDQFGDHCRIPLTRNRFVKVDPEQGGWAGFLAAGAGGGSIAGR